MNGFVLCGALLLICLLCWLDNREDRARTAERERQWAAMERGDA